MCLLDTYLLSIYVVYLLIEKRDICFISNVFFCCFFGGSIMQNTNSHTVVDQFFAKYKSQTELNMLLKTVRAFFKTLKDAQHVVCQIESDLDINNPDTKYLVCAVVFNDGSSKDYCFRVIDKNTVKRVF